MAENLRERLEIPNVLVPYPEFEADELAHQLYTLVVANEATLTLRGLRGVAARYSDAGTALKKVRKGQREHPELGHFAVVNDAGNVVGSASIMPHIVLKKQKLPLPPFFAKGPLASPLPEAKPNVHAWVGRHHLDYLAPAYANLVFRSSGWWKRADAPKPWTLEPACSPRFVHKAIASSGMERVATGYFDEEESRKHIPACSVLYARLYSEWLTSHGKLKELKANKKSFLTEMDEANDEIMSRNPRGA